MFDRIKFKSFAKIQLQNRYKIPAIITIIFTIITVLFTFPENFLPDFESIYNTYLNTGDQSILINTLRNSIPIFILNIILSILLSLVTFVLKMGNLNVFIKMTRSPNPVSMNDYTDGLKKWRKGLATGLWISLWLFIWMLIPIGIFFVAVIFILAASKTNFVLLSTIGFLFLILIIAAYIPAIYKSIQYSQTFNFAAEFDAVGTRKAINLSKIITKNHIIDLIVLQLSFIGWNIFASLTFGVANLWVYPYKSLTEINAFHALIKESVSNGTITFDELGINSNDPYYTSKENESEESDQKLIE